MTCVHRAVGEHSAWVHHAVPAQPERAFACNARGVTALAAGLVRRYILCAGGYTRPARRSLSRSQRQLIKASLTSACFLRSHGISAVFTAAANRREQKACHTNRDILFFGEPDDGVHVGDIVFCEGGVQIYIDPSLFESHYTLHCFIECRAASAVSGVRFGRSAV